MRTGLQGGAAKNGNTTEGAISVFLVDDMPELRELVRYGIEEDPAFQVVGEAGDGRAALDGIASTAPAAVLLDLSMPDMNGLDAIPHIRELQPEIAIVVFSGFPSHRMGEPTRERGADRYVEKGTALAELRETLREAVAERRG
jgi:DNA-binding NarL/FixJ family response regulator